MVIGVVIDLLSSEDESSRNAPGLAALGRNGLVHSTVAIDSVHQERPAPKRRKLSPSPDVDLTSPTQIPARSQGDVIAGVRFQDDGWATLDDVDDPIFTSSAHVEISNTTAPKSQVACMSVEVEDSDDSLPDDPLFKSCALSSSNRQPSAPSSISTRQISNITKKTLGSADLQRSKPKDQILESDDDEELATGAYNDVSSRRSRSTASKTNTAIGRHTSSRRSAGPSDGGSSDDPAIHTQRPKARKPSKSTTEDKNRQKEAKDREKARMKEQKAKAKEDETERKRQEREQKAKEKRVAAELAEVNKAKLDKKDSTKEMIVDLPASMADQRVETQTRAFLEKLEVEVSLYESTVPNVIKWRRKVKARWNTHMNHWEPLPHMRITNERHIMCILQAKEFASLASCQTGGDDLEAHVARVKSAHDSCIPIYLIEGLTVLLRKSKTAENRTFQAQVLSQGQEEPMGSAPASRRKKPAPEILDEEVIEDALMRLQVLHGCLIHHTSGPVETAEWIATFTQHISTVPYRLQRMKLETSFCMESGQVKTGEDRDDTFIRMLQETVRVTPAVAYGIASEYPSAVSLAKGFRREGPLLLAELLKSANRNGALTERKIGPAISRRLYRVFMDRDPECTDI